MQIHQTYPARHSPPKRRNTFQRFAAHLLEVQIFPRAKECSRRILSVSAARYFLHVVHVRSCAIRSTSLEIHFDQQHFDSLARRAYIKQRGAHVQGLQELYCTSFAVSQRSLWIWPANVLELVRGKPDGYQKLPSLARSISRHSILTPRSGCRSSRS